MCRVTREPAEGRVPPQTVEGLHAAYRQDEAWAQALYEHRPVAFDLPRVRLGGRAATGSGLAIFGALMIMWADSDLTMLLAGWFMVAFGLVSLARSLRQLRVATSALVVDDVGVHIRSGNQTHPWDHIRGAKSFRQGRTDLVALLLTESAAAERFDHRSAGYRRVRRVLTWPQGEDVVVLPHPVSADGDRLAPWLAIEAVYRNPGLRRQAEADLAEGVSWPPEQQ